MRRRKKARPRPRRRKSPRRRRSKLKFVVGIGNPGKEYEGTRHNIGFDIVDELGRGFVFRHDSGCRSLVAKGNNRVLVKPQTFVNRTGDAIDYLVRYENAVSADLLIVCDDVNLDFGKIRLRASGSAGGHHGLESVISAAGSEDVPRLRVGVRTDSMPSDLTDFVLGKFSKDEQKRLVTISDRAVKVCEAWIEKGFEAAQAQLSQLQSVQE